MIRIGLVGHSGRMGQEFKNLIATDSRFSLSGTWDSKKQVLSDGETPWSSQSIDVVIDFSLPENFEKVTRWCQENGVALVSGVTGLGKDTQTILESFGYKNLKAPFFWSSNMSLGIASIRQMLKVFRIFKEAKFSIVETHHIHKKDKPSGTAVTLKEDIERYTRPGSVNVESIREGEVFGIHEILVQTESEEIVLKHTALNRKVFAQGSLEVVNWIKDKTPQFYQMEDFLTDVTKS